MPKTVAHNANQRAVKSQVRRHTRRYGNDRRKFELYLNTVTIGHIQLATGARPCEALLVPTTGAAGAPEVHTELVGVRDGSRGDRTRGATTGVLSRPHQARLSSLTIKCHRAAAADGSNRIAGY
jgi:hypothetical protein